MEYIIVILICVLVLIFAVLYIKERLEDAVASIEGKRDWLTKEEAEAFTGENGAYYLEKWKDRPKSFFKGWNWTAAFFAVEWLAYRKMYGFSAFMLTGLWIGFGARGAPIAIFFYSGFSRFLDNWLAILISVFIARFIGGGLMGNIWYRETAREALKKSLHMSESERLDYLKSKGGTNIIAPVIAVVVQIAGIITLIVFYH